jgi:GxxExxY protein
LLIQADVLLNPGGHNNLTSRIINAAIVVHRELGPGLLESTYLACMSAELHGAGLEFQSQVQFPVVYRGRRLDVGYRIDILVERSIVVEIKSTDSIVPVHRAQVLTYLKLGGYPVGLLINFNVPVLKAGLVRILNTKATASKGFSQPTIPP